MTTIAKAGVCSADDILDINYQKRFLIISTDIINNLITHNCLKAQAVQIWQFLYSKAITHENLETNTSYAYLAKIFHKSIRTIKRYVKNLMENGFIDIKHNYASDGSQMANSFFIRIPKELAKMIKQESKDRKKTIKTTNSKSKGHVETRNTITNESVNKENITKNESLQHELEDIAKKLLSLNKELVTHKDKDIRIKLYDEIRKMNERKAYLERMLTKASGLVLPGDKIVTEEGDRNVTQNNNRSTNVIKKQLLTPVFDYFNAITRKVSICYRQKIADSLKRQGFVGTANERLLNEVIFAIEQDSLKDKGLNHAINIALKLIKQNRWTTPIKLRS